MIKIIHAFWDGPNPLPEHHKYNLSEWRRLNPDWDVRLWNLTNLIWTPRNHLVITDLSRQADDPSADLVACATHMADVLGYDIVYNFGGLYVNTDIQPIRPMEDLIRMHPALIDRPAAGKEDDYWVVNAAIWAPQPENPFWLKVIKQLPNRYFSMPGAFMNATTGPHLLTQVHEQNPGELYVLDRNVFNPVHWSEFDYGTIPEYDISQFPDETIAVHQWYHRTNQRNQRTLETS